MQINIIAALLILVVLIFRTVTMNRVPKSVILVLWAVVLIRLWFPVMITLPENVPAETGFLNIAQMVQRVVQTSAPIMNITREHLWLPTLLTTIWIFGAILLLCGFLTLYIFHLVYLRDAIPLKDNGQIDGFLRNQKLHRKIKVFKSDKIKSPLSYGLIRPRILLPSNMDLSDQETLQFVLQHEIFHIKSIDVLWKAIVNFTACVYWFNPTIWVYLFCVNRDFEISCDEHVLHNNGVHSRAQYANTLVKMAQFQSGVDPGFQGFSINALSERVVAVMYFKKTSVWAIILCIFITLASTTVFAFTPNSIDIPVSAIPQYCNPGAILLIGADNKTYVENPGMGASKVSGPTVSQNAVESTSSDTKSEVVTNRRSYMPNREPGMRYVYDGGKTLIKITNEDSSLYYFPGDSDTPTEYKGSTWFVIDPAVNPSQKGVAFNIDTSAGMENALSWVTKYVRSNKRKGIASSLKAQQGSKCTIYYEWTIV